MSTKRVYGDPVESTPEGAHVLPEAHREAETVQKAGGGTEHVHDVSHVPPSPSAATVQVAGEQREPYRAAPDKSVWEEAAEFYDRRHAHRPEPPAA